MSTERSVTEIRENEAGNPELIAHLSEVVSRPPCVFPLDICLLLH